MKEIECPYTWDCGKIFKPTELTDHDSEFLETATKNKMKIMFIHCPECTRVFSFDTVLWKATASHATNPNKSTIKKKEKSLNELREILETNEVKIPNSYFDYLVSKKFNPDISIFEDEENFTLYNLNELCKEISIDGQKLIQINELKGFSKLILEINQEYFSTKDKAEYTQLAKCISIGYENSRVLYLDIRDNNTLYIFHPDGGDTEKIKNVTLKDIMSIRQ